MLKQVVVSLLLIKIQVNKGKVRMLQQKVYGNSAGSRNHGISPSPLTCIQPKRENKGGLHVTELETIRMQGWDGGEESGL